MEGWVNLGSGCIYEQIIQIYPKYSATFIAKIKHLSDPELFDVVVNGYKFDWHANKVQLVIEIVISC